MRAEDSVTGQRNILICWRDGHDTDLELFGGIGSPRCALRNLGIPVKAIDYVEIDEKLFVPTMLCLRMNCRIRHNRLSGGTLNRIF